MNGWSFSEAQRQIEYKARWAGFPIIHLSRRETRGSSVTCPRCGWRLQSDKRLARKLWCGKCRIVMDRDRVAAGILAPRGAGRVPPVPTPPPSSAALRADATGDGDREPQLNLRVPAP